VEIAVPVTNNYRMLGQRLRRRGRIDGYRLLKRLGSGFSAEVWLCEVAEEIHGIPLEKGQQVALKFYYLPHSSSMESVRIQREFGIAIEAEHENLARVYDLMISPSRPNHTFMAMEYVPGPTLKDYVKNRGKLNVESCIHIARQIFRALEELHYLGAIHRDVKAANIICTRKKPRKIPDIKLVDLGIVCLESEAGFTQMSTFLGSKHSAPLEQLTGEPLDPRADIYGAGAVLYYCITGKELYANVGPEGAIVREMINNPAKLDDLRSNNKNRIERYFHDFVNQCIAVDKNNRPQSATECLTFMERFERIVE
jgi:serine/threonine-protein kinase